MYRPYFCALAIVFGTTSSSLSYAEGFLLSEESVEVFLNDDAIYCYDEFHIPDGFVVHLPGGISIHDKKLFDRTLRVRNVHLSFTLPSSVNCASIRDQIAAVPKRLLANRKVYRELYRQGEKSRSVLRANVALELPILVEGQNVVLRGEQEWNEKMPYINGSLPESTSYNVRLHPQSASNGVGLFCNPKFDDYELSFGGVSGYGVYGNSNLVTRKFQTQEACEEVRTDLLQRLGAEDPENWGTLILVTRKLESVYRYILNNDASPACQEILLESIATKLDTYRFTTVASSFPLSTVDMSYCLAPRSH